MKSHSFLIIVLLFTLTRTLNLTLLPVFNDEAIYIDWGQKMFLSGNYFFSLFDGKQPLLMWTFGLFANLFSDPLLGARVISVIFGALSFFGIYKLTSEHYNPKVALVACFLFTLSPLFLFFDRQALMESSLIALSIWNLFLLPKAVKSNSYKEAVILGILWGVALFIKNIGIIFVGTNFLLLVTYFRKQITKKVTLKFILSLVIGLTILLPLIFQKDFVSLIIQNSRFSLTLSEVISFPFKLWFANLLSFFDIVSWQTLGTLTFFLLISFYKSSKTKSVVFYYFVIGISFYILFVRSPSPRYLITFLPTALILTSGALVTFKPKWLTYLIIFPTLVWFGFLNYQLLFKPMNYFNTLDRVTKYSQKSVYLNGFSSGYGVWEAVNYLIKQIGNQKAYVVTRLDAGNPENSVSMYLSKYTNIKVIYLERKLIDPKWNKNYLISPIPIYFVTREGQLAELDDFLINKQSFIKPDKISSVDVYQIATKTK